MGLGNPGEEYAETRHNAGFFLADYLAERWKLDGFRRDGAGQVAQGSAAGTPVQLVKPQTYMNRSGVVLTSLRADPVFNPVTDLLVLVDDIALPVGWFRLRARGSAGGHNGLKSIEGTLRTPDYARLRIGVGPLPLDCDDMADYVLDPFGADELTKLRDSFEPMAQAVEVWLADGIDQAMNRFNRTLRPDPDAP
ncbi:MAG: aminoacyl-tRNA hydrolase [Gemmatimonadota bacterium]